jgi:signal transduction histidine kinase
MKRGRPLISKMVLLSAMGVYCAMVTKFFFRFFITGADRFSFAVAFIFLSLSVTASCIKYFSEKSLHVWLALVGQLVCMIFIIPIMRGTLVWELLFVGIMLLETSIYEKIPYSIILSVVSLALFFVFKSTYATITNTPLSWENLGIMLVVQCIMVASVISMTHYREKLVKEKQETYRMQVIVKQLTKTNLEYQDYAVDIEESAIEQERNRITREIHDIVGYTLTNTIMMMEAAIDMMLRNPLGVSGLINTTRENAQEGLEETRRALYKLRENRPERPKGMVAVLRMIKIYSTATKVKVDIFWNNLSWSYDEARNMIIFASIQQGLINAFIHGRATQIRVEGFNRGANLVVQVKDNGVGTGDNPVVEGIGLKGIRERLEAVGGWYETKNMFDGFLLAVYIPLVQEQNMVKADHPN